MEYVHRVVDALYNMLPFRMPPEGAILLGRAYSEDEEEAFVQDFASRVLFTYRKDFPMALPGEGSAVTSDAGWGCSIRVAQMQLAECLVHARVSALPVGSVRAGQAQAVAAAKSAVVELFQDTAQAPFSIHRFVEMGARRLGKTTTTQWFGPTSAAQAAAMIAADAVVPQASGGLPRILCFEDGVIYEDEVRDAVGGGGCVFFVCKKLGLDYFNVERYKQSIYKTFMVPCFRGLASGESTTSAYFFVATSEDSLYFLDPHIAVQSAHLGATGGKFFQDKILRIPWSRLNASMTLAFLVTSATEFEDLMTKLRDIDAELFESMPSRVRFRDRTAVLTTADGAEADELLLIN